MKIPKGIEITIIQPPDVRRLAEEIQQNTDPELAVHPILSKALVSVANQTWRIGGAILDSDSKELKSELSAQEMKKINNALESIKETLGELGIRVIDRLGEPFNAGLPDQVVTEEPREGISREQILRTIRPTIMWQQTMVQRGEIDIAVPPVKR